MLELLTIESSLTNSFKLRTSFCESMSGMVSLEASPNLNLQVARRVRQAGRSERNKKLNSLRHERHRKRRRTSPPGADAPFHDTSRCVGAGHADLARPRHPTLVMGTEPSNNPTARLDAPYPTPRVDPLLFAVLRTGHSI